MSSLSQLQQEFSKHLGQLLGHINDVPGLSCTLGEGWRSDVQAELNALTHADRERVAAAIASIAPGLSHAIATSTGVGIAHSVHRLRLAQDINLFKDGVYRTDPEAYRPLGEMWKTVHPLARWGGDFHDYDHFSFEYGGVK